MGTNNCSDLALPSTQVAPDSQQISAYWDTTLFDAATSMLFLQYRDMSRQVVTLLGISDLESNVWHWRNYTDTLDQVIGQSYQALSSGPSVKTNVSSGTSTSTLPSAFDRPSDHHIAQPCNGHVRMPTIFRITCSLTNSSSATFIFKTDNNSQHDTTREIRTFGYAIDVNLQATMPSSLERLPLPQGSFPLVRRVTKARIV